MNPTIEKLRQWGCDIDTTMTRMLDDEEFYLSLLPNIAHDPAAEQLGAALERQDIKAAFEYAHYLKGTIANLGLNPMNDCIRNLVETLRQGKLTGTAEYYRQLQESLSELRLIIGA